MPGCVSHDVCTQADMGLFAEVRYFQLHDLSIPSELSERYTQSLVLQEADEKEQYIQDAKLVRKETERLVRLDVWEGVVYCGESWCTVLCPYVQGMRAVVGRMRRENITCRH